MNKLLPVVLVLGLVAASASAAPIVPVDSTSEIEIRIAGVIKEKLKVEATLEEVKGARGDLRVRTLLAENQKRGTPRIATYIDTLVLGKKKEQVVSQMISAFSVADIDLVTKDRLKLLEWANNWNKNFVPIHVQISGDELVTSTNIIVTPLLPVADDRVVYAYLTVTQSWPAVLKSLREQGLLVE